MCLSHAACAATAGAAQNSASAEAAVNALAGIVTLVLGDDANRHLIAPKQRRRRRGAGASGGGGGGGLNAGPEENAEDDAGDDFLSPEVLAARLHRLVSTSRRGEVEGEDADHDDEEDEEDDDDDVDVHSSSAPPPPPGSEAAAAAHLKVRRTKRWLRDTAPRVEGALGAALASLATHPKPSVRAAAGAAAVSVMRTCRGTLKGAARALLEVALVLCGDPWLQVSEPTRRALDALEADGLVPQELIHDVIRDALAELPRAVRRGRGGGGFPGGGGGGGGSEQGRACAQKLLAAMRVFGAQHVSRMLLTKYSVRKLACTALVQCFAVSADLGSGGDAADGNDGLWQLQGQQQRLVLEPGQSRGEQTHTQTHTRTRTQTRTRRQRREKQNVFPRLPPRMLHLMDPDLYAAVAAVARALGSHRASLAALVDQQLSSLRDVLQDAAGRRCTSPIQLTHSSRAPGFNPRTA
jgi:hypothetical protein